MKNGRWEKSVYSQPASFESNCGFITVIYGVEEMPQRKHRFYVSQTRFVFSFWLC